MLSSAVIRTSASQSAARTVGRAGGAVLGMLLPSGMSPLASIVFVFCSHMLGHFRSGLRNGTASPSAMPALQRGHSKNERKG